MKRRGALAAGGAAALSLGRGLPVRAQPADRPAVRIGVLFVGTPGRWVTAFVQALDELGYRQGRNLTIEIRSAGDVPERLDPLAQELVRLPVDVIVTSLTPAALAARRATATIPIVMAGAGDPVATGLVKSLARPGGNVTGIAGLAPELAAKGLELMRELRPPLRHVGVLANATDPFTATMLQAVQATAAAMNVGLGVTQVRDPGEYLAAFAGWSKARADAVLVQPSLAFGRAAELALAHRLAAFSFVAAFARAGGLFGYGASAADSARRAASYADRILRGAAPAELPVELHRNFDLVLNLRTAQALGLNVPAAMRLRATEVIE